MGELCLEMVGGASGMERGGVEMGLERRQGSQDRSEGLGGGDGFLFAAL